MKISLIPSLGFSALLAFSTLGSPPVHAQPEKNAAPPTDTPKEKVNKSAEMVKELSEEKREKFLVALQEGVNFLRQKRVQEALDKLTDAEIILPEHPDVLNFKGSVFVNIRDFDRAAEYFDRLKALYPGMWQTDFNRVEMDFVRDKWEEALSGFHKIQEEHGEKIDPETLRLLDFKIAICLLKLEKPAEAKQIINKYGYFDDSPIYYYGNAAMSFSEGNDVGAAEWIQNANEIYQPEKNAIFEDSLFEAGWLLML